MTKREYWEIVLSQVIIAALVVNNGHMGSRVKAVATLITAAVFMLVWVINYMEGVE